MPAVGFDLRLAGCTADDTNGLRDSGLMELVICGLVFQYVFDFDFMS